MSFIVMSLNSETNASELIEFLVDTLISSWDMSITVDYHSLINIVITIITSCSYYLCLYCLHVYHLLSSNKVDDIYTSYTTTTFTIH